MNNKFFDIYKLKIEQKENDNVILSLYRILEESNSNDVIKLKNKKLQK